ncbi:MAG: hypothetical protein WBQ25_17660 [Nitrososphaeraceae archaeon]
MKNSSIRKQQIRNVVLLSVVAALLSITSIIIVVPIEKGDAISSSPSVIPSNNNSNATTSSGLIATSPFYESKDGKIIGQRIVSTGNGTTPQIEVSVIENGTIKGVGNVTSLGTWTNTFRSPRINYGVGQGVITTADGQDMATWTGYGVGKSNIKGVMTYHDIIFFNTNSTGKLAFLKNLTGLHTSEVAGNKQTAKIWEWK